MSIQIYNINSNAGTELTQINRHSQNHRNNKNAPNISLWNCVISEASTTVHSDVAIFKPKLKNRQSKNTILFFFFLFFFLTALNLLFYCTVFFSLISSPELDWVEVASRQPLNHTNGRNTQKGISYCRSLVCKAHPKCLSLSPIAL